LYYDGIFCPCCRSQLRTTPHNKKSTSALFTNMTKKKQEKVK
jgi:hypothetical protein